MKKRSLLQRLSGSSPDDDYEFEEEFAPHDAKRQIPAVAPERTEGHLPVDMYQTPTEIVVRTFVAGVRPEDMNVSISRDMVVIEGSREERSEASGPDYFNQELFWGAFSRTVMLPQEVDVDGATATSKDGLLTIVLPKLDRARQTKLRVKSS
ncbi:MAG TPA: Hsp20/alpha crystallin family protein [Candidatus Paceibacterota bacterium]|nr:Hsp20/alpha crystallin family protein [Candidatus Paceibacterota bacterium]